MRRRRFLQLSAAALAAPPQKPKEEAVTATATQDQTPRVGIVLSSFAGSEDHDGTKVAGLADPQPAGKDLSQAQLDAMVRKAIEIGGLRQGGLETLIALDDWVVIKTHIPSCPGLGSRSRYVAGAVTDLRVVRSLVAWLAENKCGRRISIVEGSEGWQPAERSKAAVDGWTSDWGGAFGGLSYKKIVEEFAKRYPAVRFEIVDLNFEETVEMPVPGQAAASQNPDGLYHVPKTIQQCDKLISVAPLKTHPEAGVALSMANYLGIAPGAKYGFPKSGLLKLGAVDELIVDLFSYHPAEFALVGGSWGVEGDGTGSVHHNVVLAGASAAAVDTVAAAVMGFNPAQIRHLQLAERKGLGGWELEMIWTRGSEVEQARRAFRQPAGWKPAQPAKV